MFNGMVFWKCFFNFDLISLLFLGLMGVEEFFIDNGDKVWIFFIIEWDIDFYELEELCDVVGWVWWLICKVKKVVECSFLVVIMWEM